MEFNKEDLNKFLMELNLENQIELNKIPDIDLYMDQVIQLFESNLETSKRNPTDKILTKTMINNYSKDKLLFPNKNKKYSKEHMLLMILTYDLKQVLSIGDIKRLFNPMVEALTKNNNDFDMVDVYEKYLEIKRKQLDEEKVFLSKIADDITSMYDSEVDAEDKDYRELLLIVCTLLNSASLNKRVAEKIIDKYF